MRPVDEVVPWTAEQGLRARASRNWIAERCDHSDAARGTVSAFVPCSFEAYVKILHPIFRDVTVDWPGESWDEHERRTEGLSAYGRVAFVSGSPDARSERVLWRSLAEMYEAPFDVQIDAYTLLDVMPGKSFPRALVGPMEGSLDGEHLDALVRAIVSDGETSCRASFFPGAALYEEGVALEYQGDVEDLPRLISGQFHATPEYWWADSKRWLVWTDWDATFTVVGGYERLIRRIELDGLFEAIRVGCSARIFSR